MNRNHNAWSDHDLERFIDDDLAPDARERLGEALRADASLRARLAAIIEADATIRAALLQAPTAGRTAPPSGVGRAGSLRRWGMGLAAAAAVALAAIGALRLRAGSKPDVSAPIAAAPEPDASTSLLAMARTEGILIASAPEGSARPRPARPEREPTPEEALLALLERDELSAALAMLQSQPSGAESDGLWAAFGRRLTSGRAAQEALLALPPERQIDACRAWAAHPSLRPATFEWLARLGASGDESVRRAVAALRLEMHARPELRPWLLSYAGASGPEPRQN
ncbi:MAG: hypothetical protein IBJ10_00785 [Phycisphaerales bacterium]|nr:hypothetical protein [Phycisphaerales bacterium]